MCLTKLKAGLVISTFIYSDPCLCSSPPCGALFCIWQEQHFINGSKWQGRAILESGSFLHHMKTLSQHARGVHHTRAKENMVLQRVWKEETKETQQLCQEKKNQLFPWKMTMTYFKHKSLQLWKFFYTQYLGERHWCGPLTNKSSSLVLQCYLYCFKFLGTWSSMGERQIHHLILTTETSVTET